MKKSVLVSMHLVYWLFTFLFAPHLFTFGWIFTAHIVEPYYVNQEINKHFNAGTWIILGIGILVFYASYFSLNFFVRKSFWFIVVALFYVVSCLVVSLPAEFISNTAVLLFGPVLYFNLSGFLFKACLEWFKDRKRSRELEKARELSQLELLKSKIDPHFLFNNLNNIDVFIQEDPKLASDYMKKLSDILRFMLYEANAENVPLSTELDYINRYIDLQKIRTSNASFVKFELSGHTSSKKISPMILIHFIENAFKHAGNKKIENAIEIKINVADKRLFFYCKNHVSSTKELMPTKNGMGIPLLKQKLDLLYKKEYSLSTKEENNWYLVTLDIPLHED